MKKIDLATAGVAVPLIVAASLGAAQTTATTASARADATTPVLPKLPAEIANRKRLIAGVKCDTLPFGYLDVKGQERRRRRRDREAARPLRVRPRPAAGRSCVRHGSRAAVDDGPRRPDDLDVHVHGRSRHEDRFLAAVLQGDGTVAGQDRLRSRRSTTSASTATMSAFDLRLLDEAVLHRHHRRGPRQRRTP